jgi:hypothetical protein
MSSSENETTQPTTQTTSNQEKLDKLKALLGQTNQSSEQQTSTPASSESKTLSNEEKLAKLKNLLGNANKSSEPTQSDKPLTNEEKLAKLKGMLAKNQKATPSPQSGPSNGMPPFVQQVIGKNYHVFIGTPCYGGMCHVNYVVRLMNTQQLLAQLGIQCTVEFMKNESLITRARNNMVAKFMSNPETTHLLFIDADITWHPMDVVKLLAAEKDVVGGIYPKKRYAWERLTPENIKDFVSRKKLYYNKDKSEEDLIRENLVNYNLNYDRKTMKIENNLLEIYTLATGFFMVSRGCLKKMMEAHPASKYIDDVNYLKDSENDYAYALFDCIIVDTHYMSEDWTFCHRWRELGGKVYCDVSICLNHSGTEDFSGRLLSSLVIQ